MKNKLKLILDAVMTLLLLLMIRKHAVSLMFHEVAGLALIAIMAIHLFLNFAWVRGASKKVFSQSGGGTLRASFIVDTLLFVALAMVLYTGIHCSMKIFPNVPSSPFWKKLHFCFGQLLLAFSGVHLGLHFSYIRATLSKSKKPLPKTLSIVLIAAGILLAGYGLYCVFTTNHLRHIIWPFVQQAAKHNGKHGASVAFSVQRFFMTIIQSLSIMMFYAMCAFGVQKLCKRKWCAVPERKAS